MYIFTKAKKGSAENKIRFSMTKKHGETSILLGQFGGGSVVVAALYCSCPCYGRIFSLALVCVLRPYTKLIQPQNCLSINYIVVVDVIPCRAPLVSALFVFVLGYIASESRAHPPFVLLIKCSRRCMYYVHALCSLRVHIQWLSAGIFGRVAGVREGGRLALC